MERDEIARQTKVVQPLKAVHGYGPPKVAEILERISTQGNCKIGHLGDRERKALLDALD